MERMRTLARLALSIALGVVVLGVYGIGGSVSGLLFVRTVYAQDNEAEAEAEADTDTVIIMPDDGKTDGTQSDDIEMSSEEDAVAENEEEPEPEPELKSVPDKKAKFMAMIKKNRNHSIDQMPSLFFTYWQHQSIIKAKESHGVSRPPTKAELKALESAEKVGFDPEKRYVYLGGIVYNDEDDWIIWLNGKRVIPDAVPEEVLDLRVYKDYIEVKWLDEYTNSVFPLRLRAHQRFNLDMMIFLPG